MYEQICYQKTFLKQVIARLDFAGPVGQLEKGVPIKLLNALVEKFPIVEPPSELQSHEVSIESDTLSSKRTVIKQWNYFAKDRSAQLTLAPQNVVLLYTAYRSYEETREQVQAVVDALAKSFPETKVARFGLRYVNQLDMELPDATDWSKFVDASLLGVRAFFPEGDLLTRLMGIAELKYGEMDLRFQFGMPNADYPAPIRRPLYVLDVDASVSQAHDFSEVVGHMDSAHDRIQAIFERSITGDLRGKMDAKPVQP